MEENKKITIEKEEEVHNEDFDNSDPEYEDDEDFDDEDPEDELYKENPLKAIWIKLKELEEKIDNIEYNNEESEDE